MSEVKYLKDYQSPDFTITAIELSFHLKESETRVVNRMRVKRLCQDKDVPLVLDGVNLQLLSAQIDGLDVDCVAGEETLTLTDVPDECVVELITEADPKANTSLEGLYLSDGAFCTQCEAEGFRKITYYLDRPDVLATFRVTIHADQKMYPYLLSNGNKVGEGTESNGMHWATWEDPHPKPCYLFALVAGDFALLTDSFVTESGRNVALELYVDKGNENKGGHALESLKRAMAWDEQRFNLEYDLGVYMVVAVDFFNMGAMENKGLNVFNSKYVLATAETATDEDFFNIESVIGHEYFHNWTGNRVTCRDWFQLSLKEGLTVFRDQEFSADMASPGVVRINSVKTIREHQFAEDAGPMSHPIRPEAVMEMNNFYTVTVYNKGAEVIRMIQSLLGKDGFQRGMALYFERHDGQAVTCDDFVNAMADANGRDLTLFKRWYRQSGTPVLSASQQWDPQGQQLTLELSQHTPPTADQTEKQPLHMPVALEVITQDSTQVHQLELAAERKTYTFDGVESQPIISLLGGFSAPVKLVIEQDIESQGFVLLHGKDPVARWDASQVLYSDHIHRMADALSEGKAVPDSDDVIDVVGQVLEQEHSDTAMLAELLTLPSFDTLALQKERVDVDALLDALKRFSEQLGQALIPQWTRWLKVKPDGEYRYTTRDASLRRISNLALYYLALSPGQGAAVETHFASANNMTDSLGALKAAQVSDLALFDRLMQSFEHQWHNEPLVMDKWFSLQATTDRDDILPRMSLLMQHASFSIANPNRVRSLVGSFGFYNHRGFHCPDGSGYKMLTDYLIKLDRVNPQVASRLLTPLIQFQRLDEHRKGSIRSQLMRLANIPELSKDMFEKIGKSLAMDD